MALVLKNAEILKIKSILNSNLLLGARNIGVSFRKTGGEQFVVLDGLNLEVFKGEFHSIIGNSGSGKSVLVKSLLGLNPESAIISGNIVWEGESISLANVPRLMKLRGSEIAMIFQDPISSLNPALTIEKHFKILANRHINKPFAQVLPAIFDDLAKLNIENPKRVFEQYPHQISGGMAQRVMIAMILLLKPKLILADEPTSNLDVATSHEVLRILKDLTISKQITVIHISHDLQLCAKFSTNLSIMAEKRIVESGKVEDVLHKPQSDATKTFLSYLT